MTNFIEEFYYGNIDPQARSFEQNKKVQRDMQIGKTRIDFGTCSFFIRKEFIEKLPVSMLLFHSKLACRVAGDSLTSELWAQSSVLVVETASLTCT